MRRLGLLLVALLGAGLAWWAAPPRAPDAPADRALPRALPAGPLRVTTFGTSLTAKYDWPAQLQAALTTCRGAQATVSVVARPGAGSTWALTQIDTVAATQPDLIVVEFAINDADLRDGVSLAQARRQHHDLITALQAARPEAQVALMTMSPAQGLRGAARPYLAAHYLAYRDYAAAFNTGLVDLYPRWLARPRDQRGLAADGLHPTAEVAHQVIVPTLASYLADGCAG